jgi:hypothetical protein
MKKYVILTVLLTTFLVLGFTQSQAEVVGRFTQVVGRVDLLKGGNLPATPVKVDATVEPKDVVRTKSLSKAQIKFIDNSTLTISPGSRIAIDEYMINPAQGKRRAVLKIFQGLALAVVNKIYNVKEPDFVVKTQTAIMGVRGTEFGIRILPNSSTIMNFKGLLQVGNVFPEISQLFQKAFKVAYAFGPITKTSSRWVFLKPMQATSVARDLPPTLPYGISMLDKKLFMQQLTIIAPRLGGNVIQGGTQSFAAVKSTSPETSITSVSSTNAPGAQTTLAVLNTVTVPPVIVQQTQINTFSFAQTYTGPYKFTSTYPFTAAAFASAGPGSGTRTGVYPGSFTADYNFTAVWDNPSMTWSPNYTGSFEATMTGQVSGTQGQTLTGTMQMTFTDAPGGGQFKLSGPVSISPSGEVVSQFTGTGVSYPAQDAIKVTEGTITQTPTTPTVTAPTAPTAPAVAQSPSAPAPAAVVNTVATWTSPAATSTPGLVSAAKPVSLVTSP